MNKRTFKDNDSYFRFINTYKDKINIVEVKPIKNTKKQKQIILLYEIKE